MKWHESLFCMSIEPDVAVLQRLDHALRQVSGELDDAWHRRRVVSERVAARWSGGDRRRFTECSAQLDTATRRTRAELAALGHAVRAALALAASDGVGR